MTKKLTDFYPELRKTEPKKQTKPLLEDLRAMVDAIVKRTKQETSITKHDKT